MIKALKHSEVDENLLRHTKKARIAMFAIYIICIAFLMIYCALAGYQITLLTNDLFKISIAGTVISAVLAVIMIILIYKVLNLVKPKNNLEYHNAFIIVFVFSIILLVYSIPMIVMGFKINIHYDILPQTAIIVTNCQGVFCGLVLIGTIALIIMVITLSAKTKKFYKALGTRIFEDIHQDGRDNASAKSPVQKVDTKNKTIQENIKDLKQKDNDVVVEGEDETKKQTHHEPN